MSVTNLGTLVTYNPWAVGPTAVLDEIAARFAELRIHHVPVVDSDRQIIGIISDTDLLRARQLNRLVLAGSSGADTGEAPRVFARDIMARKIISIPTTGSVREALGLLLKRHIHMLPVVDGDRLVGVISSRDFLREFSYGEMPGSRDPVSSLLAGKPSEAIEPDTPLDDVLLAMQEIGINCFAVGQGNCPIGIVSQRDIVREKCRLEERDEFHPDKKLGGALLRIARSSPPIRSGQRLCEAASTMIDHALPAVTVVNQSNRLLGLITEDDLLRVMYHALA
jgi:acetoin utilization protein AcuB